MEVLAGESGLKRAITTGDLYRPGLEMAGYFNYHPRERIQMLGKTEITFMEMLTTGVRRNRVEQLCAPEETPCIIVTRGLDIPTELLEEATKRDLPVLRSQMSTTILQVV